MEAGYRHSASRSSSATNTASSGRSTSYYSESTSPKLLKVVHYLSELFGSYDTEKLCRACLGLSEIIQDADRDCLHLLSERDVIGVVIKMMQELPSHSSAQQAGCEVLLSCNEQIEFRSSIEERNAYRSVLSAIKSHPDDPYLLGKAIHALASFASTAVCETGLRESKAYKYVLIAISANHFDVNIQTGGLKALASLLRTDTYAVSNIARQGEHRIIFDAIRTHETNADVVAYGFQTLQIIAGSVSSVDVLIELTDILVLVMEQLQKFSDNEAVVAAASSLIEVLTAAEVEMESDVDTDITSTESETSRTSLQFGNQVVQLKVLHLLTEILVKYTEVLEIQVNVFSSIEHIYVLPEIKVSDTILKQWLQLLNCAFQNHGVEMTMMEAGCRCLARLLALNPHLHTMVGADDTKYQIPLHNSVWITLLTQSNDPTPAVFRAVTMALFFLVVDDESLQQMLLQKGASEALHECLREYINDETRDAVCVEYGCRALRGILMHSYSDTHKNYLVTIGIVKDLVRILNDFDSEAGVVSEAFCVIACLADIKSFQEAVLLCSLCKQILEVVEKQTGHDIVAESALEVLILLSQNAGIVPLLHDVDVFGATVAIMRKHVVSPSIQCKGCVLIRLLSQAKYLISKSLCTSIAKVVIDALARKMDHKVQTEALFCAYTLCECSAQMSEALVLGDIHLLLFTLLYREPITIEAQLPSNTSLLPRQLFCNHNNQNVQNDEDNANNFVFQVGADIIYNLSCIRDFKQEMLTTAIKDGLLEGVKVLVEIGADVNSGEDPETPICLAVHSRNKAMVDYLLQNGVNSVHKALSLSREMKLDEITGLLLEHMGLDRNGDMVNLSGLELCAIKPAWILPSLGIKYSPMKRTGHRRNSSLVQLNEVLKHRISVDLGVSKNSEHPPPSSIPAGTRSVSATGKESLTAASLFKTRSARNSSPVTPIFTTWNPPINEPSRTKSGYLTQPTTSNKSSGSSSKEVQTYSAMSSLRKKLINSGFVHGRRSRSSTPDQGSGSDGRPSSCSSDQESAQVSRKSKTKGFRNRLRHTSKSPHQREDNPFSDTSTSSEANKFTKVRRSGLQAIQQQISPDALSAYEPSLSPISGTPTHKAKKKSQHLLESPVEEIDSGFENVATNQANTNLTVVSPMHDGDSSFQAGHRSFQLESSDVVHNTSKMSQILHSTLSRRGTITGVAMSRLPFSRVDGYSSQRSKQSVSVSKQAQSRSQEEFSISSSQLVRQLKKFRKNRKKGMTSLCSSSTIFYTQLDSPGPVVNTGNDNYCDSEEMNPPVRATFTLPQSVPDRASNVPDGKSEDVQTDLPAPLKSVLPELGQAREESPISDRSNQLLTPVTSICNSLHSSTDVSFHDASGGCSALSGVPVGRDAKDEIDFGGNFQVVSETDEQAPPTSVPNRSLIKGLDLSSNKLTSLKDLCEEQGGQLVFNRLIGLHRLDMKQNQISELPREMMQGLTNLSFLNLSCNSFVFFPTEAILSHHLTSLDLSVNKISKISSLPCLPNLVRLNLSKNHLEHFPPTLTTDKSAACLPHLRFLNLQSNQISSLPNHNTLLKDLEELNLSNNQIRDLPDQFLASVISLRSLIASRNELSSIDGEVGQDLVHLTSLKVAHNHLGESEGNFNNFITLAPVLQSLDASENGLTSVPPPYAWTSRGIRDIRLTGNKITRLDLTDGRKFWPHLESLYLGENKLREIPKEIGGLHSLSCLDVSHNRDIRHLPDEMGNLEYLFMLNLKGLKNLSLDPALQNGSTKALISYLKSRHTKSVPYYQMKMMLIGAAAKGKTTLLNHLISDKPIQPSKEDRNMATLGVNVKQWSYPYKPGGHGSTVTYHVSCWDFAGQEEFYSTHQCFLSQRSLYVLVYNLAQGESELQYLLPWLLNVQARAPSSPVLIVGTHVDKLTPEEFERSRIMMRDKIRKMLQRPGFPGNVSFGEINCFDEKLVINLRGKIKMLIDGAKLRGQKIMGGQVPSNYLALEEIIQREKKRHERLKSRFPVLQARRLKELMDASKLSQKMDKAETERAIQFLHECGVLLNYSDLQTKLSELYFLHPKWLCMLMAQIITIPEINPFINKDGFMEVSNLNFVLKEPQFPAEFLPEYIRLLERFEVALRQTSDTLLIPSHLPKTKPQEISLPQATLGSRIVRRYLLCYIPPGFWPRLVARLFKFPKRSLPSNETPKPTALHIWSEGMYAYWSEKSFFLVSLLPDDHNAFDIVVPTTNNGTKLLCSIVDNIEALIDEWFPGLRDLDIVKGASLVTPMSLCPLCTGKPHSFPLKQLMEVALTAEEVDCPSHGGPVILEQLAPDIVIGDLESCYKVAPGEFFLEEVWKNFLGKGGFGEVYKAEVRGQPVAVKVFSQKVAAIYNMTPNHLIRQEVQILSRCQHPFIISMIAVTLRPKPMLFMEFAELGSLNSFYPYSNISRVLKHRIAFQVAGALEFLHQNDIIYRDLKPDNILIFSLSTIAMVNAKLSDYGIACYATESGLTQPTGTPGCKAPELLMANSSSMTYNDKVDIYSYGLTLFVIMTNGHKPFEELSAGYEIDKFIVEGRPINDIDHYGCRQWPDMQDLINHCLQYVSSDRPSAKEIFNRLCSAEFVSLKRAIQVERDHPIELFTTRTFKDKDDNKHVEVWMVSFLGIQTMLSIMNLTKKNATPQGMMMPPGTLVRSIVAVESSLLLMGTSSGNIFVYDSHDRKLKHQLTSLEDSVLCLMYFRSNKEGPYYVCAGLAKGKVAFYDQYMLKIPNAHARLLTIGDGPVRSIKRHHGRLYACCGKDIVVIRISDFTVEHSWNVMEGSMKSSVTGVEVGQDLIWTTHSRSPKIQVWDIEDGKHRGTLHCDVILRSMLPDENHDSIDTYVTSIHLQSPPYSIIWIGLSSGHILIINASSRTPLMVTKRHVGAVCGIQSVKALMTDKPVHLILTAGFGFRQRPGHKVTSRGTPESYGNLLVWDSVMPKLNYDQFKKQVLQYR